MAGNLGADNRTEEEMMDDYGLNALLRSGKASTPIPFGKIGDMLSDISQALAADTPPPPRPGLPFGDQMSLPSPRSQIPSNQASPVELNPLSVTPPMQRPGDQAIQALARLYPGLSL